MKKLIVSTLILPALAFASVILDTDQKRISYALGQQVGTYLKQQKYDYSDKALFEGIIDMLKDKPSKFSAEESVQALQKLSLYKQELKKKQNQEYKNSNEAFLHNNAKDRGVVTRPSGLQYTILRKGAGAKPKATDTVFVHYKGMLLDGTVFDSSYTRAAPISFPLNRVIKGWTEGLQLMRIGAKWKFFIPSYLAYGKQGFGNTIPPDSTLIFEVELLDIK